VTVVQTGTGNSEFIGKARTRLNNVQVWAGPLIAVTVEWSEPLCVWTHDVAI